MTLRPANNVYRIKLDPDEHTEEWPTSDLRWRQASFRQKWSTWGPEEDGFYALVNWGRRVMSLYFDRMGVDVMGPATNYDWLTIVRYKSAFFYCKPVLVAEVPEAGVWEERLTVLIRGADGYEKPWYFIAEEVDDD